MGIKQQSNATKWIQLISAVLDFGPQLLWKCYQREEVKMLEQQGKVKKLETSQVQILGQRLYSDPLDLALYNEHNLSLCSTAALSFCDGMQELDKKTESYIMVKQGQKELFSEFFKD